VCRQHSRKQKGSNNRSKHRIKLSRVHEKVTNQRNNFLHQKSSHYIKTDFITFCFEDLNVKGMVRNHKLAQSINDVGWSTFRKYLTYKADWTGKNILTIGRFDPSSKLCSNCGTLHRSLTLRDRIFKCQNPKCNLKIDRDYQASLNIKKFAFHHQNMVNDKLEKIGKELAKSIGRVKAPR
jgi:putative transposase